MSLATQVGAVTATNLRSIPARLGSALVIVVGIAGTVAVLISVLAMSSSFRATMKGDARADRAIVLSRDATTEYESGLSRESVATIANASGIRRDARGRPIVSAEVVLAAPVARKRDHSDVNVTLRGVGAQYFALRPELKLVSGRMFRSGHHELLAGVAAQSQFAGLQLGDQVRLQGGDWTVVGSFAGGNGSRESELIADAQMVMSAYKLQAFNSMTVALDSAGSLAAFRKALNSDPRLFVDASSERDYLATASSAANRLLSLVAYAIGSIMALGALFGALNSMHSEVTARAAEIAMLRAIGFASTAVAAGVLIEALMLALLGAAIGAAIAYLAFDGTTISTVGGALFDSQLVYSLTITPSLLLSAVLVACTLGLAGGILPAIGAARSNIAETLHET